jgi:hypothetical protein
MYVLDPAALHCRLPTHITACPSQHQRQNHTSLALVRDLAETLSARPRKLLRSTTPYTALTYLFIDSASLQPRKKQ